MTAPSPTPATAPQPWCHHQWTAAPTDPSALPEVLRHTTHDCGRGPHGDDEAHRCGWCGAVTAATHPPPSSTGGAP